MAKITNIALAGTLRSGKTEVAAYLTRRYGYGEYAFGNSLKDDFHRRYPEIPRFPKPRKGYQSHGQLMREMIDADIWVNRCFDEIRFSRTCPISGDEYLRVVISDVRQLNEYARCRAEGFVIIRISAPDELRLERARAAGDDFDAETLAHETESYVDSFVVDYDVANDGSLAELYTKIDAIIDLAGQALHSPQA